MLKEDRELNGEAAYLIPGDGRDKFATAPLVTGWLRMAARKAGYDEPTVAGLTSHSFKRTIMDWATKYGLSDGVRRRLGGWHAKTELMQDTYSSSALEGPLAELRGMLEAIAQGGFHPDAPMGLRRGP